jgi:transcriptional regulator with XRE-family HTH domain
MNIIESMRKKVRYTAEQVARFLGVNLKVYISYEQQKTDELPYQVIEQLAALYHVTEYEILTGTAQAHSITGNPQQEEEIIPFMKIIENYLLMNRLLDGARHDDPCYRIAWSHDGGHRRMAQR